MVGFTGTLTPTGQWYEDAWLTTAMLTQATERLKFLVAFRPGLPSPTLAAQMASTYQRQSAGRLLLNILTGGESREQRAYGDHLNKHARYARTDEFPHITRTLRTEASVDFAGQHPTVQGAKLSRPPDPLPPIYFTGSPPATGPAAARHADAYLTWGEPPADAAKKTDRIKSLAATEEREPTPGIRLHVITRDTSTQARAETQRLLDHIDPKTTRNAQQGFATSESEGQRRMAALHRGSTHTPETHPNLWARIGLARGSAATAPAGSHTEIADRIAEYTAPAISEFIPPGHPHLEEAYRYGESVLPLLEHRSLWRNPLRTAEPVPVAQRTTSAPLADR